MSKKQKGVDLITRIGHIFRNKEGKRLDFDTRPYWKQIYNDMSRYVVLMTSRQIGKSTFQAIRILFEMLVTRNTSILFANAKKTQNNEFRQRSLLPQIYRNRKLLRAAFGKSSINNAKMMKLSNGSTLHLEHIGTSADSARGSSARTIIADEVQDIPRENLDVIMESAASFPKDSKYRFTGTCKDDRNLMYQLFLDTCQFEWIIPCASCQEDNPPIGMEHLDLEREYLFCSECKKPINSLEGRWVAQNPKCKRMGYRIPRLIDPNTVWRNSADGILDKYEIYSRNKFLNEVMALPSIHGEDLITLQELESFCEDRPIMDPDNVPRKEIEGQAIIAAIDWAYNTKIGGVSHTIISIAKVEHEHIKILYMKRFSGPYYDGRNDPDLVLNEIVGLVAAFGVDWVFADHRIGNKENQRLKQRIGKRFVEVEYSNGSHPVRWKSDSKRYSIPKTESLDRLFNQLRAGRFTFPNVDASTEYLTDILNVYTHYNDELTRRSYERKGGASDDFLDLLNFTLIAAIQYYGDNMPWLGKYSYQD
ncbi:MAG: phage terminase large subunit family protein [Candidatus Marinimicrobia bacterium]|nr:phage terminase large subunit family protein [Candidatus Neomarinimicrobiota bacterium]